MLRRRTFALAAAVALASSIGPVVEVRAGNDTGTRVPPELCGDHDLPETGLQGDVPREDQQSGRAESGYNCGVALVGHATLDQGDRSPGGNANMAWSGHCAYVSGGGATFGRGTPSPGQGIAVVDVSDPAAPVHVSTLTTPGSALTSETLHAVDAGERHLLVAAEYGNQSGGGKPMDVYDVTDCAAPQLLATFIWPENVHNLTISGNGRYVFATQPLQVADLEPLFDADPATGVRYLGNLEMAIDYPIAGVGPIPDVDDHVPAARRNGDACSRSACYGAHEAWPTHDGRRLIIGGQLPVFDVFAIVDIGDWLADPVNGKTEVLSQRQGRGHSIRTATIDGRHYALHSEESVFRGAYGCLPEEGNPMVGAAEPWLTDITDPTAPEMRVSQLNLEINRPEHCGDQLESGVQTSVHYHDVDDPANTTFAMVSMWNAGLRIVDVRDPLHPTEVGYFNPGDVDPGEGVRLDQAWGHVRYIAETGHIWFATASGGFWVVELEPQVRSHLGLPEVAVANASGAPARLEVTLPDVAGPEVNVAPYYCTIGIVG